jgi:hypothetical protein
MGILATSTAEKSFQWTPQPQAAALVNRVLSEYVGRHPRLREFSEQLHNETGTRLLDWVDHLVVPRGESFHGEAAAAGYTLNSDGDWAVWRHTAGMFPPLVAANTRTHGKLTAGVAIKVEDVDFFLQTHHLTDKVTPAGAARGPLRVALVDATNDSGFWIVERHGFPEFSSPGVAKEQLAAAGRHFEQFKNRRRKFENPTEGFALARDLIQKAEREIGIDWAADRFFAAERIYWQSRNRAGQIQYARQQQLGLGWANHDHHTYRSSRQYFRDLIATLELLGFECRERFYAGREAGWGAQVLEQHNCGLCVFADVDLSPDEVADDFAHQQLADREKLGTVGLWCALHGEAFLEAGMHHLEAQFDFDSAREQLNQESVGSMAPFTNLPYLRQAFTVGEVWPVEPRRIDALLAAGKITAKQADTFRREGALGSHLEVLQRDEGYKGFNQTGISDIITRTDPRRGA